MSANERIKAMLERQTVADLFTCMAVDKDIIFFEDGWIGSIMQGNFLTGANQKIQIMLKNLLAEPYPADTFIQDIQLGCPDLRDSISPYRTARIYSENGNNTARQACDERADFINSASERQLAGSVRNIVMDTRHFVTLKVPIEGLITPTDNDLKSFRELRDRVIAMYESASISLRAMTGKEYLGVMRRYTNMFGDWDYGYEDSTLLRDQIAAQGTRIQNRLSTVRLDFNGKRGRQHIGVLTIKRYPKRANIGVMDLLRGTPDGRGTQITIPYAITTTIRFPDQNSKISKVRTKGVIVTQQSFGQMLKWVPALAAKKRGFDVIGAAIDEGNNVVEANTTVMLFHPKASVINKIASRLASMYATYDFEMKQEKYIVWPTVYNSLPLCPTPQSIQNSHRFKTMGSNHAAQFLPIIDEWRGYGDAILLTTRRGRPFNFDFFSPLNLNFNWTLIAKSGAGKSFAVQRLLQDYLSLGAQIYVVDKRRSHAKFTMAHGGEYVEFTDRVFCSLNPFSEITDIDESVNILLAVLGKICNPTAPTSDAENVRLMEATKSVWATQGTRMEITHIYSYLSRQNEDDLSVELARKMYPFTVQGPFGAWFRGANTFSPKAQLTTIEMAGLDNKPHLQQVIQQLIMIKVEAMMYQSNTGVKKIMIVEEGGDLMKDDGFARFLAALYSKVRKETGSVGLILQSLSQLYGSKFGQTIAASCDTRITMEQNPESVTVVQREKWVEMSDAEAAVLKSLHTVKGRAGYSELHFSSPGGSGIARLVEPRFNQVLFSTEGRERSEILQALDAGEDVVEAVREFVRKEENFEDNGTEDGEQQVRISAQITPDDRDRLDTYLSTHKTSLQNLFRRFIAQLPI